MMKIAFVCEDVHKDGGTERVVYELATRLAPRHRVHVFSATARGLAGTAVTWHRVPVPDLPTLLRVPSFAALSTLLVRREPFDAVIGQGVNTWRGDYMVVHTTNAAKRDVLFQLRRNGTGWSLSRRLERRAWYLFTVTAEKLLLRRRALNVIAVSSDTAREVMDYYPGLDEGRVKVVFNGVDCDEFHDRGRPEDHARLRAELGVPGDARIILFAGGEWWRKGLSHVVEALAILGPRYYLAVAGRGPEDDYRAQARRCGVAGRVRFLGLRRDMPALYRGADALVLPSYYETFSLVTLEAMASALPVFVSRFNGPSDYLRDGANGFYVERDGRDIAASVETAFRDEGRLREIAAAARATARRFTWARAAAALEAIVTADSAPVAGVAPE
jgi:glycosyltransferase involved in cell wall biosynthesis